jgi:hypothetical protein
MTFRDMHALVHPSEVRRGGGGADGDTQVLLVLALEAMLWYERSSASAAEAYESGECPSQFWLGWRGRREAVEFVEGEIGRNRLAVDDGQERPYI